MQEGNEIQSTSPIDLLKKTLYSASVKEQFTNALAGNSPLFMASILELFVGDKELQKCDPNLIVIEALKSAVLKLPISKVLGFSYIIAYNESIKDGNGWRKVMTPHFQLGYKGLIQLAKRSGVYRCINADYIYAGEVVNKDRFTGELSLSGAKTSDEVTGYFAYFEEINGFRKWTYRTKFEAERHAQKYSKTYKYNAGAWKSEPDKMHLKGVLRDLLTKWGTLSIDIVSAVSEDILVDSRLEETPQSYLETIDEDDLLEPARIEQAEQINEQEWQEEQQPPRKRASTPPPVF